MLRGTGAGRQLVLDLGRSGRSDCSRRFCPRDPAAGAVRWTVARHNEKGDRVTGSDELPNATEARDRPLLSVLTIAGTQEAMAGTYASLQAQSVDSWEWVVAGDPSATASLGAVPAERARITTVDDGASAGPADAVGPAAALVRCLAAAQGEHVLVLAPGDLLADETVWWLRELMPAGTWGYSDEVQVHGPGRSPDVWGKPDHSPERLRAQPYPVRSAFLPRELLMTVGGFRTEAASAVVYDAVLRLSEERPALHIPHPLVLRTDRDARRRLVDGDPADHVRAVEEHCRRTGIEVAPVESVQVQGRVVGQRVSRVLSSPASVSIVIPTRGSTSVVEGRPRCHVLELLRSVWVDGRYPDLEVVVVYDVETPEDVLEQLRELIGEHLVLVPYDDWFHFSRKCNIGALAARGDYLCFLNDDTEVRTPDWLHEMVGRLSDPGVGAVGARLLFADGTLQHIGHHYGGGHAGHPLFGWRASTLELGAAAHVAGERVGVTAACMLVRAADFLAVGGFSEAFPLNYNDVDLCLKLREAGFRLIYTPHAELYHFESQTRVARVLESELRQVRVRWGVRMTADPYLRTSRGHRLRAKFVQSPSMTTAVVPTTVAIGAATDPDVQSAHELGADQMAPTGGER